MADAQRFFQPVDRFIIQPVYLGHIFHFDRVLLCVLRLLCPCVCCIFSRHISFRFLLFHYSRSIACFLCFLQFLYAEKHTSFYVLTKNIRIFCEMFCIFLTISRCYARIMAKEDDFMDFLTMTIRKTKKTLHSSHTTIKNANSSTGARRTKRSSKNISYAEPAQPPA